MPQYLTQADVDAYGIDVVHFAQRAAADAMAPQIDHLAQQNDLLRQRLAVEARRNLDARVEKAVPDYRSIDGDPRWHSWLLGTDILSGRVRQTLLDDAIQSGDASRIANFFRKFLSEADGAQAAPVQRRARTTPANGPIYTRPQIAQLYRQHQQGAYRGRESTWAAQEADIIRAAAENRILGGEPPLGLMGLGK